MKFKAKHITLTLLLSVFISCSSRQTIPKYYILEPIKEIQPSAVAKIPINVVIKPFSVSGVYNQKRIVFRSSSNEIQYYYYHMWAEKPSLALRYFVKNYFSSIGFFKSCSINSTHFKPDYFIDGEIDKIERIKGDDNEFIGLKINLQFSKADTKELIASHPFSRNIKIETGIGMNLFARTISQVLTEEMNIFLKKIETNFKRQGN
jgi:ABC-type uncharacterized transport system auxiliary subunit